MSHVMIWVTGKFIRDQQLCLSGEPCISTTGIARDKPRFDGTLFAITRSDCRTLGSGSLSIALSDSAGMHWEVRGFDMDPEQSYLLTDDSSCRIKYDGIGDIEAGSLMQHRLGSSTWDACALRFDDSLGVIMPVEGHRFGRNRIVLFGGSSSCDLREYKITDVDESLDVLGAVTLS